MNSWPKAGAWRPREDPYSSRAFSTSHCNPVNLLSYPSIDLLSSHCVLTNFL